MPVWRVFFIVLVYVNVWYFLVYVYIVVLYFRTLCITIAPLNHTTRLYITQLQTLHFAIPTLYCTLYSYSKLCLGGSNKKNPFVFNRTNNSIPLWNNIFWWNITLANTLAIVCVLIACLMQVFLYPEAGCVKWNAVSVQISLYSVVQNDLFCWIDVSVYVFSSVSTVYRYCFCLSALLSSAVQPLSQY